MKHSFEAQLISLMKNLVSQSQLSRALDVPQSQILKARLAGKLEVAASYASGKLLLFDLLAAKEVLKPNSK